MHFKELKYILAIAEYGSISKAADFLGITQPSLSKYINNLEKQYGVKLLTYCGKSYQPTYAGGLYIRAAQQMLKYTDKIENYSSILDAACKKKVIRLFFPMLKSSYIIPNIVPQFKLMYPNTTLIFNESMSNYAEDLLLNGDVDVAITNFVPKDKRISFEPLVNEEILLVISKNSPFANEGIWRENASNPWVDIKMFRHEDFILPDPGQRIRQIVDSFLESEGIIPNILMTTKSFDAAVRVAATGAGIAFIPENYIYSNRFLQQPVCFSVGNFNLEFESMIAYLKNTPLAPEVCYLIDIIKKFLGNYHKHNISAE
ncbi:MAG: LysR substrate-binding domain-containing protein [Bacillota bacterium]|jgi:DNA-binding transcriptional LysR family regulator